MLTSKVETKLARIEDRLEVIEGDLADAKKGDQVLYGYFTNLVCDLDEIEERGALWYWRKLFGLGGGK